MTMSSSNSNNNAAAAAAAAGPFGDTTLTKVFVGGLAWETPKEILREHFENYGDILEAVIIFDKATGRSKGYGFVTFKETEAAKKACEDATPIINGRRANCNLAAFGARRPYKASPPPQQGANPGPRPATIATPPPPLPHANRVQWYYHDPARMQAQAFHHQQHHHHAVPYYGYSPTYITTDHFGYNHKLGYTGGTYINGLYSQVYPTQPMMNGNTVMPVYPYYQYPPQSQTLGLPAHYFPQANVGPVATGHHVPAFFSKPATLAASNTVCLAVE